MTFDKIIESGFIKAYIESYYEGYDYDVIAEDKLNFSLCNNDEEKQDYILKKSKQLKTEIKELGYHELSFGVIQSMNPQIESHFVDQHRNPEHWLERFCREIEIYFESITPIHDAVLLFNDKKSIDADCLINENSFWDFYPISLHPQSKNLIQIIEGEFRLLGYIEDEIQNFEETEFWEIDIDDYRRFIEISMPMKIIQDHSELYSRLFRLFTLTIFENKGEVESINVSIQEPSQTRDLITEIINGIDRDKGWEYAFRSREDLDVFVELLTCFFEQREYELPDEVISLNKRTKTRLAAHINEIHMQLSDRTLKGDTEFFDIVRVLDHFQNVTNLYNTISKAKIN